MTESLENKIERLEREVEHQHKIRVHLINRNEALKRDSQELIEVVKLYKDMSLYVISKKGQWLIIPPKYAIISTLKLKGAYSRWNRKYGVKGE